MPAASAGGPSVFVIIIIVTYNNKDFREEEDQEALLFDTVDTVFVGVPADPATGTSCPQRQRAPLVFIIVTYNNKDFQGGGQDKEALLPTRSTPSFGMPADRPAPHTPMCPQRQRAEDLHNVRKAEDLPALAGRLG